MSAQPESPRVWPVVVGSLGGGLVLAILSVFVFFGGAREPVISGTVLLSFALGWTLLGLLASTKTRQPQHWAYALAAFMAAIAFWMLGFNPSDAAMDVFAWIWPVPLIGLVVWSFREARRTLHTRTRAWLVVPVLAILLLAGLGGAYQALSETVDRTSFTAPGRMVDVGGYRLHLDCRGAGSPTVVLVAGLGEPSPNMAGWVAPHVAKQNRVCMFDRAGEGWSDAAPTAQDGLAVARDLNHLLQGAGEVGPFVLAGHSAGGLYALIFAGSFPEQVEGVVLLDSMSPQQYEDLPGWSEFHDQFLRASALMPSLSRIGILSAANAGAYADLPEPQRGQARHLWSTGHHNRGLRDEFSMIRTTLKQAADVATLGDTPLIVVTAQKDALGGWLPLQDRLVSLSSNSAHRVLPGFAHAQLTADREGALASGKAILDVVTAARSGARISG